MEQGQDLSKLDQDELDGELLQLVKNAGLDAAAGLAEGYHWTWRLPEGTVTENRTILQEAGPIRFYVAYDAGYDDYEWDDNVPMENSVFTYDSSANTLKECEYQRPGYEFAGWAGQNGAHFMPGPFTAQLDTFTGGQKIEQGQIVTLRALWTPASYTVTYNGNFPGWDSPDGEAGTMEASRYSIGTDDSPLPDCGFTRSGYRFVGWAFEADAAQAALTQGATLEDAMKQGGEPHPLPERNAVCGLGAGGRGPAAPGRRDGGTGGPGRSRRYRPERADPAGDSGAACRRTGGQKAGAHRRGEPE